MNAPVTMIQSPLAVESGFVAARDALSAARQARALTEQESADLVFLDGMAVFEQAIGAVAGAEDAGPDPALTRQSLELLADAARAFQHQHRPVDEACAHFRMARALQELAPDAQTYRDAAEHYRRGLERLDTTAAPELAFDAYLRLGRVVGELASTLVGAPRDAEMGRALALLEAADFLAGALGDRARAAHGKRATAVTLAARFRPDRDTNLFDAIARCEEALWHFRGVETQAPVEYGGLLVELGNCWLKVNHDRRDALERARAAFSEGVAAIDAQRWPRLHGVLARNLAMTEALIAQGDLALPEDEMVGRFDADIQTHTDAGRLDAALQASLAFLQWGWSRPAAPNVHVAVAHRALGALQFRKGAVAAAEMHLYCSLAVLCAVLEPAHPWFAMVGQAKEELAKLFTATGRAAIAVAAIAQAERAWALATELCRTGGQQIGTDPDAALGNFEEALRVFPCSPDALFYRGVVHLRADRLSAALADFDASLQIRPKNVPALGNRFTVRRQLGDLDGALADCDAILELDPAHAAALFNRAELRLQRGDPDGAIADHGRLLDLDPTAVHVRVRRALAREQKGDLAGATADLERALPGVEAPESRQALLAKIEELRARLP